MTAQPSFETRVAQYVKVRDKIKEISDRQKEELKPYKELLEKLNSVLLGHLNSVGAENVGTAAGTVYKTVKNSASIADMSAFWTYVVTQGDFDMVDKKANPTAVAAHIDEHGVPPPGVNWTTMEVAGVRRK